MKLHKKLRKSGDLSKDELKEYATLKAMSSSEDKKVEENKEYNDKLSKITSGCVCLKHYCEKCTVALKKEEKQAYNAKLEQIKKKSPTNWDLYECFIMKAPSNETVLVEYAGGYLEPVSVRQFLKNGTFTINGDNLELINRHKKYGGFFPHSAEKLK